MNAATESEAPIGASAWTGFAAMCLGMFMAILDVQVVATSLPTIQKALAITPDRMSWIQTAYLIAEIISIPLTGTISPDGGCPERFYLSRRWSIGQDGVTIGDDANNALGVLTFSGGQFAGKSAAGTPVTLSRQKPAL